MKDFKQNKIMTNKKKLSSANNVFLIIRGERSEFHKAPFCPIVLCSRRHTSEWEAGNTEDGCTVLYNYSPADEGNWILTKYKGYNYYRIFVFQDEEEFNEHSKELIKDGEIVFKNF